MAPTRGPDYPLTFPPPVRRPPRPERHLRSRAWLWAGRVLLVAGPLFVVTCIATAPGPRRLPVSAAAIDRDGWLVLAIIVAVAWLLVLPLLVLPFGPVSLARVQDHRLVVPTVLGTRRLPLPARSVQLTTLANGMWPDTWFISIRHGWRRVVVVASAADEFPADLVRDVGNFPVSPQTDRWGSVIAGTTLITVWALVSLVVLKIVFRS